VGGIVAIGTGLEREAMQIILFSFIKIVQKMAWFVL
jgi:hypothetical protein